MTIDEINIAIDNAREQRERLERQRRPPQRLLDRCDERLAKLYALLKAAMEEK